jgi:hypothetical protein
MLAACVSKVTCRGLRIQGSMRAFFFIHLFIHIQGYMPAAFFFVQFFYSYSRRYP